ncbi:MAG TPA: segregation/condensation protein A [Thermomicrobiales bacterium]|nr:segregation/condensation protein A [Thermomicrobiales bacterium]
MAHESLAGYQLRLPSFEGALDVLLSLIERERMEISNLSLVTVTDGFLAYIADMRDPPPAMLAEFAGIAARLLVLKSRSLLPRPDALEPETDVDDLAAQLRDYQQAKQSAEMLRDRHVSGVQTFSRGRRELEAPTRIVLVPPPLAHLHRALLRTLTRARPAPDVVAMTPLVTISDMIDRFRSFLSRSRRTSFRDMVGSETRSTRIAGFIALLTLWRRGEVHVRQDDLFGDIRIEGLADLGNADAAADD